MKARSREINIFNMSLLDVLCGALGAFCFMMLTLFPYYSKAHMHQQEPLKDASELQQDNADAQKQLKDAERRIQELESDRQAGGDAATLQQRLEQAREQLQQARQKAEQAAEKIQTLDQRFPISVQIMWLTPKHDVDIYLWRPAVQPQPEPTLANKNPVWIKNDTRTDWNGGPGFEAWQIRDFIRNVPTKVYYILFNMNGNQEPSYVSGSILSPGDSYIVPTVQLDAQTRILHVADLIRTNDDKLVIQYTPDFEKHRVGEKK